MYVKIILKSTYHLKNLTSTSFFSFKLVGALAGLHDSERHLENTNH